MANIKSSSLQIVGTLTGLITKHESVKEGGEVVPEHIQLQFLLSHDNGIEIAKVKDINSKYKDAVIGQEITINVRVTASNMGQTFYEVA